MQGGEVIKRIDSTQILISVSTTVDYSGSLYKNIESKVLHYLPHMVFLKLKF